MFGQFPADDLKEFSRYDPEVITVDQFLNLVLAWDSSKRASKPTLALVHRISLVDVSTAFCVRRVRIFGDHQLLIRLRKQHGNCYMYSFTSAGLSHVG